MVTGMFTCCTHVHMKVLNCGGINRVVLDTEVYISGDVYMESILVYCFHCVLISFVGMGCNEIFCRYTNNATCSSTRYVYEDVHTFSHKIREDVRNVHASCSLMPLHFYIAPSLIFNYSVIDFSSCKIILSHPSCNATTDGRTSTTA